MHAAAQESVSRADLQSTRVAEKVQPWGLSFGKIPILISGFPPTLKPQHLFFFALLAATSARGMELVDPLANVEHPADLELSPLSPSITYIPLPTEQNSFVSELEGLSGRAPNFFVSSASRHSFGDVYSVRGLTNGFLFTDPPWACMSTACRRATRSVTPSRCWPSITLNFSAARRRRSMG
jgi:hypothetical protein